LHEKQVVHRDIKGDNFLMSRKDIEHPQCRVFLCDFGTVVGCEPGDRLQTACGTKPYWSPEFYRLDYAHGVDIWAVGVILFSLFTAKFVFRNEADTKEREVVCPPRATPDGAGLVKGLLEREEQKRMTSKDALLHPFLAKIKSAAEEAVATEDCQKEGFSCQLREQGANHCIQERRLELVERLGWAAERNHHLSLSDTGRGGRRKSWCVIGGMLSPDGSFTDDFSVANTFTRTTTKYEWWSKQKVQDKKVINLTKAKKIRNINDIANCFYADGIRQLLEDHGIETAQFGQGTAKKLEDLVTELKTGHCRLMLDASKHKSIVRVVDLTLLRFQHGEGRNKRYLVKYAESYPDDRVDRADLNHLPGTKKQPHQSARHIWEFVVSDRMQMHDAKTDFKWRHKECIEEEEVSVSYPGVRTVYRKEIYDVTVENQDPAVLKRFGLGDDGVMTHPFQQKCGAQKITRTFHWLAVEELEERGVTFKAPVEEGDFSALVNTPIGLGEAELTDALRHTGIDINKFGQNGVKSIKDFSDELIRGESQLAQKNDGSVIRLVDVVMLKIEKPNGEILVASSEQCAVDCRELGCLPVVKRRPDEHPLYAGRRVLNKVLQVNENLVTMDNNNVLIVEESSTSSSHAGMTVVFRQFVIPTKILCLHGHCPPSTCSGP